MDQIIPGHVTFLSRKMCCVVVEEISDNVSSSSNNVSSAAKPSLANASSSIQTATTAPTSPACFASTNGEPSCTTAAHIWDTDTCTDDAHDTALVI